jgi:hypothetical protein
MAQSGYTPILIYASGTTTNVPSASNLTNSSLGSELALNYADGKLFYKDASNAVQVLASSSTTSGSFTTLTASTSISGRYNPRVSTTTSTATLTPNISTNDQYNLTAQAATLTIAAPTGTPLNGNKLIIRVLDNGSAQTLSWNATYTPIGITLPTVTTAGKMLYVGCIYNADNTRWDVVLVTTQV